MAKIKLGSRPKNFSRIITVDLPEGGKGSVEIDQLTLRALPVDPPVPPQPLASDRRTASTAANAVDLARRNVDKCVLRA